MSDAAYLRELAERLFHVPMMYNIDQGDAERVAQIAANIDGGASGNEIRDGLVAELDLWLERIGDVHNKRDCSSMKLEFWTQLDEYDEDDTPYLRVMVTRTEDVGEVDGRLGPALPASEVTP